MNKPKVFFYHYNKPASKKAGKPVISLHYNRTCHLVNNIKCYVPTYGKINKKQPFFVIKGKARLIQINHLNEAMIYD